jgi:hypothetical protein
MRKKAITVACVKVPCDAVQFRTYLPANPPKTKKNGKWEVRKFAENLGEI